MRDRTSDRERFFITANYDINVTGNLERALQTCEAFAQAYPREKQPRGMLGAMIYPTFGKFDKGVQVARQLVDTKSQFPDRISSAGFQYPIRRRLG